MAKKKISPIRHKQLTRIRKFIRETEKRGYRYSDDFKSSITSLNTNTLKSLTPEKLYSKATALSERGVVISGTERKKEEVKARKSTQQRTTNKKPRKSKEIRDEYYTTEGKGRKPAKDGSAKFTDVVLQNIEALISEHYDSNIYSYKYGARLLRKLLDSEIAQYGRELVARGCEQAPEEAKHSANVVVYASSQDEKNSGLVQFAMIITGTTLNIEEAKEIGEAVDNMESYEENED